MPPRALLQLVFVLPEIKLSAMVVFAAAASITTPKPPLDTAAVPAAWCRYNFDEKTLPEVVESVYSHAVLRVARKNVA